MPNVVNMEDFRKPRKPIVLGDVVELEKRNGRFFLQGAEVRVRIVGEQSPQPNSVKNLLERVACGEASILGYTIDPERQAILVPVAEGETNYKVTIYEILGENFPC